MTTLRTRARRTSWEEQRQKPSAVLSNAEASACFRLLELPYEIRRLVLHILLVSPTPLNFCYIRLHGRMKFPSSDAFTISPQVLRVSKELYAEGRPLLYQENVFGLTHTLALTSRTERLESYHIQRNARYGIDPLFWTQIRQLQVTVRTTTRNGQLGQRSILGQVHHITEYILNDNAPLRSLEIIVMPEKHPLDSEDDPNLSSSQLFRMLKPLTLLRVSGRVTVKTEIAMVSKRTKKEITDTAHPVPNIYHLRDGISAKIKEWAESDRYWRPDLRCVRECDVAKVKKIHDDMMAANKSKGVHAKG